MAYQDRSIGRGPNRIDTRLEEFGRGHEENKGLLQQILDQLNGRDALREINARLSRVEHLLVLIARGIQKEDAAIMALKATDDEVIAEIHRTQDTQQAANIALTKLVGDNIKLTSDLATAIENSGASDDPAVREALNALKASNDAQQAATPAISAAINNTDPNAEIPA